MIEGNSIKKLGFMIFYTYIINNICFGEFSDFSARRNIFMTNIILLLHS